jgi:hypothetical protein
VVRGSRWNGDRRSAPRLFVEVHRHRWYSRPAVAEGAGGLHDHEDGQLVGTPLRMLGLSARTFNSLTGAGIELIEDLDRYTDRDLLSLKNFGRSSLAEARAAAARWRGQDHVERIAIYLRRTVPKEDRDRIAAMLTAEGECDERREPTKGAAVLAVGDAVAYLDRQIGDAIDPRILRWMEDQVRPGLKRIQEAVGLLVGGAGEELVGGDGLREGRAGEGVGRIAGVRTVGDDQALSGVGDRHLVAELRRLLWLAAPNGAGVERLSREKGLVLPGLRSEGEAGAAGTAASGRNAPGERRRRDVKVIGRLAGGVRGIRERMACPGVESAGLSPVVPQLLDVDACR